MSDVENPDAPTPEFGDDDPDDAVDTEDEKEDEKGGELDDGE